ncbi:MAG: permease [Clostridiales bacterium]
MKRKNFIYYSLIIIYFLFILISFLIDFQPGKKMGMNFRINFIEMIKILPFTFILIGLFEVWVKKETVEKYLGVKSGFIGYILAILLGGTTIGPMIVSLPVAFTLFKKGAKLSIVFTYVGAAAVCRIPMTIFEVSYLGMKFTAIRYLVSIPLIIITSVFLGKYLEKRDYELIEEKL